MNDGMPVPRLQSLQAPRSDVDFASADASLRALLAICRACNSGGDALDICRQVVALIVEHRAEIYAARIYRAAPGGRQALCVARAGERPRSDDARIELDGSGRWPTTHEPSGGVVVALGKADAAPPGWLCVDTQGPVSETTALFVECVSQPLALALAHADARSADSIRAEALVRREETMASFLADISNEIRTPLTLVLGPLEAAAERHVDHGLRTALRQAQRLKRLVEALLDLSLIDAGRVEPMLQPIDIGALTRDVASLFHGVSLAAGITLTVDCPNLAEPVLIDRQQWETIVINLLGNAIRSAPLGEVTVSLKTHPGLMTLEVSDTGRRVPDDDLPLLFARFPPLHDRENGGLALALVQELVHLHGGEVAAGNSPGGGTRFRVCIPMLGKPVRALSHRHVADLPARAPRARVEDVRAWAAPPAPWTPIEASGVSAPASLARILVAIEHRDLREYVGGLLEPHYRVQSLASADAALRAVAEREPDLVLVDLGTPAIDGLAFLRRLREQWRGTPVPALLLSWDTRAGAHADAMDAGADDLVGKPFAAAELLARVGAHVRLAAERRALHRRLSDHNAELEGQVAKRTAALAASEAQFKTICNLVPDILWRTDAQGRMEWRSAQWQAFTGDDGVDEGIDFVHPDDRARTQAWVRETVAGREVMPHEYRLRGRDGMHRWFIARMAPLTGADGAIQRWFGSATDIERHQTARHALEARVGEVDVALAQAAGVQQELLRRLSLSQEEERRRIARELHDSLGQYLTALKLALSALAPVVSDVSDARMGNLVQHLGALTTEVDRELDDIIAALRPVVLDELGLAGALPVIVSDWSRQSGIPAETLMLQVGDERFEDQSESTLYRVTQESLTNIAKHAQARHVAVTLTRHLDELQLTVEDDGIGFDVGQTGGGWGLRGMAERARSAGGLLQVESSAQGGTTVLVRLPCRPRLVPV